MWVDIPFARTILVNMVWRWDLVEEHFINQSTRAPGSPPKPFGLIPLVGGPIFRQVTILTVGRKEALPGAGLSILRDWPIAHVPKMEPTEAQPQPLNAMNHGIGKFKEGMPRK